MTCNNIRLSEFKNLETQIEWNNAAMQIEWFVLGLETRSYGDHKGAEFRFELLKLFSICITFYDSRHDEDD